MSEVPDYIEPVVGWRVWNALDDGRGVRLASVIYKETVWPERRALVAVCNRRRVLLWPKRRHDEAPADGCGCGIHAATFTGMQRYLPGQLSVTAMLPVVGRVSLWGVVHEFDRGWRASHAYPQSLYVPRAEIGRERAARIVNGLSRYGVPVYTVDGVNVDSVIDEVSGLAATA